MSLILSFVSPLEFLLRYTVIIGMLISALGVALCVVAKKVTLLKSKKNELDKSDKLYIRMISIGFLLILAGMIVMILPYESTFYVVR